MIPHAPGEELRQQFGDIDIYLFDQILRGRFDARRRVLDAGCGDGRNLIYFLRHGFDCHGADSDASAVGALRETAACLAPSLPPSNFVVADVGRLPHGDASMQAVICSAVLHFAEDQAHFDEMVADLWRVLAPGGLFFARLASNIGLEHVVGAAGRQVRLPDGTDRFLVDEATLLRCTEQFGGRLADPIKTTNGQQQRCMTTWCAVKRT
jgi:SAM-dependent methyltransferase